MRVARHAASAAGFIALAVLFIRSYLRDPAVRGEHNFATTWWSWNDQALYHMDVLAWGAGNFAPAAHYYFPGYALVALPFLHITPLNPFCIPDFVSFLATVLLLAAWARRLLPDRAWAAAATLWLLFICYASRPNALQVWLDPWDTTPVVPLCLWCLLAALRFSEHPTSGRAFWVGFPAGAIFMFRPTDALVYGAVASVACGWALTGLKPKQAAGLAMFAALGAACGVSPGAAAYLLSHGLHPSGYFLLSRQLGFDVNLLPQRWVSIMLDSRPWLAGGPGLIPHYPWLAAGLAGILAAKPSAALRARRMLGAATLLQMLVYLSYRDLHPTGLFLFGNQHYFKGAVATCAVFTIVLADAWFRPGAARRGAAVAMLIVAFTLPWRLALVKDASATVTPLANGLYVPAGLAGWYPAVRVEPCKPKTPIALTIAGKTYQEIFDFKTFYSGNGVLLLPVRTLPTGPASIIVQCDSKNNLAGSYLGHLRFALF
jgi:hypothetical protein